MNKIIKIIGICIIFLTFGCKDKKYMTCSIDNKNEIDNYSLKSTYKVYYDKSFVTMIEKEDIYTSDDKSKLEFLQESNDLKYNNLKDLYGGYDYEITLEDNTLKIIATINLKDVDLDAMARNGEINSDYIKASKLTTSGAKYLYSSKGATCVE